MSLPHPPNCPFCLANGKVKVIAETQTAYLIAVLHPTTGEPMLGCYFIIPKDHIEHLWNLPPRWQMDVQDLLLQIPVFTMETQLNLSYNQGAKAGQRVQHVHGWVVIRDGETDADASYQLGLKALIELANAN